MTAEVATMNKKAVALAADSASTTRRGDITRISYESNKIFSLSKYHPVGIMIYGNASINDAPWEPLIKQYRTDLGTKSLPTTREYYRDLVDYLENDRLSALEQGEEVFYSSLIHQLFYSIWSSVHVRLAEYKECAEEDIDAVLDSITSEKLSEFEGAQNKLNYARAEEMFEAHRDQVETVWNTYLEQLNQQLPIRGKLDIDIDERVRRLCLLMPPKLVCWRYSGIVVVGYGSDEMFPSLFSAPLYGSLNSHLYCGEPKEVTIGKETSAAICPFAQKEMATSFMEGIHPDLEQFLHSGFLEVLTDCVNMVVKACMSGRLTEQNRQEIAERCTEEVVDAVYAFRNRSQKYRKENYTGPVLDTVEIMTKEELATVAETLVHLQSFKQKMSLEEETVGGPIDVAVISKGDGLVWIKRKHYFDPELNHHFFGKYFDGRRRCSCAGERN